MSTAACATARLPNRQRVRCAARSLIYLADLGTVPELVESSIANLRLLAQGSTRGSFCRHADGGLLAGIARLQRALAGSAHGLDVVEQRLLGIGLSLLESTPQFAAALPAGAILAATAC